MFQNNCSAYPNPSDVLIPQHFAYGTIPLCDR